MSDILEGVLGFMDDMSPRQHIDIYTTFVNRITLKDSERASLKKERGFTDELIDMLRFKSCCPENSDIIKGMIGEFGEEELLSAGLLQATEKGIKPCGQLLGTYNKAEEFVNNILIPYFDENGKIFFIRPHKFGLKDKGINIYAPVKELTNGRAPIWIITESEFKAAAAIQYGYPAIGLPGIHSFSGVHFERLQSFIESHSSIERIVIIYDNEIKNNKLYKNYKPDVRKQWDTQWRAVQMCRVLSKTIKSLKSVTIGVLPKDWMVDGKIDIDGALAQGRSPDAFRSVIYNSLAVAEYLKTLAPTAQKIIQNKIYQEDFLIDASVKRENNAYHIRRKVKVKGEDEPLYSWERVCNFVMDIKKTMLEDGDHLREVTFIAENGTTSKAHTCKSSTHILREFKTWVGACGNFIFTGNQDDLDHIWEFEYAMSDGRKIVRPQGIGYIKGEEEKLWLFGNALVKEDGTILTPDEEGVIWDGLAGYQPKSINETIDDHNTKADLPTIDIELATVKFGLPELKSAVDGIASIYGTKSIYLGVGWVIASLLSEEIFDKYSSFPLLFIGGKRESGKTTLGNWLMAMAGFPHAAGVSLGSNTTTPPGVERSLAWHGSLPFWLDEYRNNKETKKWEGFFRNSYQRQSSVKGSLNKTIRKYNIRASILISGEETPEDNALLSRCLIIPLVSRKDREATVEIYNKIDELKQKGLLSRLVYEIIKRKKEILPYILGSIDGWKKRIIDQGVGERIALNFAIVAVCYDAIFLKDGPREKRQEFAQWVINESHRTEKEKENEHMLAVFMEDIVTLQEDLKGFYCVYRDPTETKGKRRMALHFTTFYNKWTESYRRSGHEQFKRQTMLSYIREESYYIKENFLKKVEGKTMRCLVISLDPEDNPPDGLLTIADGLDGIPDPIPSAETNGLLVSDDTPF